MSEINISRILIVHSPCHRGWLGDVALSTASCSHVALD